ncbi:MAG: primosomal protein N' [Firmicutes bacterium]|nr:primosomal protein N' [Bacillota bacterium]
MNRKIGDGDKLLTYEIPAQWRDIVRPGMAVSVPLRRETLEGVAVTVTAEAPAEVAPEQIRPLTAVNPGPPLLTPDLLRLAQWMSRYYLCPWTAAVQAMLPAGLTLSGRPPQNSLQTCYRLAEVPEGLRLTEKRRALAAYLQAQGECSVRQLAEAGFDAGFLRRCLQAGMLTRRQKRRYSPEAARLTQDAVLSPAQEAVYRQILEEIQGENRPVLLHGQAGSGKTEIYCKLVQRTVDQGGQAIVLTPEIALAGQMAEMLQRRFAMPVALLHSALSGSERRLLWQDIAAGKYQVAVGPRSALFAPFAALRLIVVDEEQESSYKQDNQPRFHGVTAARMRARFTGAALVLGSATPSVESYYLAEQGTYAMATLTGQYYASPPPAVTVADMRRELRRGNATMFSQALGQALQENFAQGGQSVLFLNRRGYYHFFFCRDCGHTVTCPHCAVAMAYHGDRRQGTLKCHYCGQTMEAPALCPRCGSPHIRRFGAGVQRVEEEVKRLLPQARVLRLDSDMAEDRQAYERVCRAMRRGEADILVGTQMLAKGLDFPGVTLAAVMAADAMLNLPDWRAGERAFQLISQLCGRAGRRRVQGRAIIQTYSPAALPVAAAAAHDYQRFYRAELADRRERNYPPFCRLTRLLFLAKTPAVAQAFARQAAETLRQPPGDWQTVGPSEAPFGKINDWYRWQVLLKYQDFSQLRCRLQALAAALRREPVRLVIDVDPFSLL